MFESQAFFGNRHQHINGAGDPDLGFDAVYCLCVILCLTEELGRRVALEPKLSVASKQRSTTGLPVCSNFVGPEVGLRGVYFTCSIDTKRHVLAVTICFIGLMDRVA